MPTSPVGVLDKQLDLLKWWKTPFGRRYADVWLKNMREANAISHTLAHDWEGIDVAEAEAAKLDTAETYWVSDKMCHIIEEYAKATPSQPLLETDLPTRSGFVWFDKPLKVYDITGSAATPIRAFMWAPVKLDVGGAEAPWSQEGRGVVLSFYWDTWSGQPSDPPRDGTFKFADLTLANLFPWRLGEGFHEPSGEDDHATAIHDAQRFVAAFWAVSQQKVVGRRRYQDRHTRKRMERSGQMKRKVPEVEVIRLRAEYEPPAKTFTNGDGREVEWTCWWIVEPHYQRYHTREGVRWLPKDAQVKGDLTKPFREKPDRVWKLDR